MRLTELIKSLGVSHKCANLVDFEVSGISCNSKQLEANFVFVAVKGSCQDGGRFIDEAIENGAGAVIIQARGHRVPRSGGHQVTSSPDKVPFIEVKDTRQALAKLATQFYGNPSSKMKVVGITGTNGKTTVSYLIEALLNKAGAHPAVIGTINYRFKDRITKSKNTTPGPTELQSMLSDMLSQGANYCIMEVSSHALDQDRTGGIDFHSAVFTNLTQDHLDYHKTQEKYFLAKARLFKNISQNSFVVINNDDRYSARLKKLTQAKLFTYGIKNKADVTAKDIKFDSLSTEFRLITPEEEINFKGRLIGRHNVYNLLATASWAKACGIDTSIIKSALEGFSLVPGRLQRLDFDGDFSVFVDYAHTEDALKNILNTLRGLCKKKVIVVFGCGGERDRAKRPKMGKVVSELSDYAIITNDNPRSEDPVEIIKDIERGIRKNNYCVVPERREAIKKSLSLARAGDIVLVAGKGHEDYQILGERVIHFDDCQVVRECLRSMSY